MGLGAPFPAAWRFKSSLARSRSGDPPSGRKHGELFAQIWVCWLQSIPPPFAKLFRHPLQSYSATRYDTIPPVNQVQGEGLKRIIRAEGVLGDSKLLKTPFHGQF